MCVFGCSIKTDIVNHPYFLSPFSENMIRISIKAISSNPAHSRISYHTFIHGIMVVKLYIYDRTYIPTYII